MQEILSGFHYTFRSFFSATSRPTHVAIQAINAGSIPAIALLKRKIIMEEITKIEKLDESLGWGTVSALLTRAGDMAYENGREDIVDMLSDAMVLMESHNKPSEIFFDVYQFAWRMYFRVKTLDKNIPLNRVTLERRGHEEVYVVTNYDYKMFLWAKQKGFGGSLTNFEFVVDQSKLTPSELRRFSDQAEK